MQIINKNTATKKKRKMIDASLKVIMREEWIAPEVLRKENED